MYFLENDDSVAWCKITTVTKFSYLWMGRISIVNISTITKQIQESIVLVSISLFIIVYTKIAQNSSEISRIAVDVLVTL